MIAHCPKTSYTRAQGISHRQCLPIGFGRTPPISIFLLPFPMPPTQYLKLPTNNSVHLEQHRLLSSLVRINHDLEWKGDGMGTPKVDFIFLLNQKKPPLHERNSAMCLVQLAQKATSF